MWKITKPNKQSRYIGIWIFRLNMQRFPVSQSRVECSQFRRVLEPSYYDFFYRPPESTLEYDKESDDIENWTPIGWHIVACLGCICASYSFLWFQVFFGNFTCHIFKLKWSLFVACWGVCQGATPSCRRGLIKKWWPLSRNCDLYPHWGARWGLTKVVFLAFGKGAKALELSIITLLFVLFVLIQKHEETLTICELKLLSTNDFLTFVSKIH